MKQTHQYIIWLLTIVTSITSCKKYLTVQPESSFTRDQVFASERSAQQALNGIYNYLADNQLYGSNLSTLTIELLGQRFKSPASGSSNNYQFVAQYNYSHVQVQPTFEQIWQKAYSTIVYVNDFIPQMDKMAETGTLTTAHAQQMKGEAIAIRAMLHFDMLRLFGPVYVNNPTAPSIPYYTQANGAAQPLLPASQVLDNVLTDLTTAEDLLLVDPVISRGINNTTDFYSGFRNQRLNYFAVKALMARAYLWGGNTDAARDSAQAVLANGEKWFPWTPTTAITNAVAPDRVYSSEILFGSYNQEMYNNYISTFSSTLQSNQVVTMDNTGLDRIFEANKNDYRYAYWYNASANGFTAFDKFKDIGDQTKSWRFVQPLVRKTELYYILAETDVTQAKTLLDTVRYHRGLPVLAATANLPAEIKKEYQKEFWGEGQIFYYYKRTKTATVMSGSSTANVSPVYLVPLPLSETTPR
ncbi:hypothetical protein A4H97_08150 [Niastella yeongjuensis]|uniref:SusD-like N-terminal domain-containing protein n=1 Tax=Niastella yeongjuensis TaxID=354355 RepID=A0A1V9END2_9BACT|nr:RagB/SusD family nutrient uptake outer membrane protein [Niastella yeongjuensis]OQP47454.1 hypothetical protein A4H97_08150 [Niastella yeongjuensis]SEN85058.1 SusD family protein [Niastella yeongjuensis]